MIAIVIILYSRMTFSRQKDEASLKTSTQYVYHNMLQETFIFGRKSVTWFKLNSACGEFQVSWCNNEKQTKRYDCHIELSNYLHNSNHCFHVRFQNDLLQVNKDGFLNHSPLFKLIILLLWFKHVISYHSQKEFGIYLSPRNLNIWISYNNLNPVVMHYSFGMFKMYCYRCTATEIF